jgi:pectin lyase
MVTMKGNYIHHMSGRSPKVQGNTLLHAVNNYWYQYSSSGHAFEVGSGAYIVAEGNVFQNVPVIVQTPVDGQLFTAPTTSVNADCASYLGHTCVLNAYGSSGAFSYSDEGFFSDFSGKNIASAGSTSSVQSTVPSSAGFGTI